MALDLCTSRLYYVTSLCFWLSPQTLKIWSNLTFHMFLKQLDVSTTNSIDIEFMESHSLIMKWSGRHVLDLFLNPPKDAIVAYINVKKLGMNVKSLKIGMKTVIPPWWRVASWCAGLGCTEANSVPRKCRTAVRARCEIRGDLWWKLLPWITVILRYLRR